MAAVSALLLSLCFFDVQVRLAPRWVLSRTLGTVLTELETRFETSPAHLLGAALDPRGRQQISLQLETESDHLGVVRYDLDIQTQLSPNRVQADGTVVTGGRAMDLSLYLDQNFAAVSSQGLVSGKFYGITYESFSRDIRDREVIAALIGDKTITQWEESVSGLEKAMATELILPELTTADIRAALYGVLTLKPSVRVEEILISGQREMVYAVSFRATGREIAAAAESYREELTSEFRELLIKLQNASDNLVSAVFYLRKGTLVKIAGTMESPEKTIRISADLGSIPGTDPLKLECEYRNEEDLTRYSLVIDTESDQTGYEETLHFSRTQNGIQRKNQLGYRWDLSSGDMKLTILRDEQEANLRLNLQGEGESFTVRVQDVTPLVNLFREKPLTAPAICTLQVSPGSSVDVPAYRNLDQWSMEDLVALLSGLGGLLGLQLP